MFLPSLVLLDIFLPLSNSQEESWQTLSTSVNVWSMSTWNKSNVAKVQCGWPASSAQTSGMLPAYHRQRVCSHTLDMGQNGVQLQPWIRICLGSLRVVVPWGSSVLFRSAFGAAQSSIEKFLVVDIITRLRLGDFCCYHCCSSWLQVGVFYILMCSCRDGRARWSVCEASSRLLETMVRTKFALSRNFSPWGPGVPHASSS